MNGKKTERIDFNCKKLGGIARISLEYRYHKGGVKRQIGFHCDDCCDCGVAMEVAGSWSYDWDKCIYPNK